MSADLSVRVGWAEDAAALSRVQSRAWRATYADVLPEEMLQLLTDDQAIERWRLSLTRPADARQRVMVALDRASVCGFTLTHPATDPDCDPLTVAELGELVIDPDQIGRGHGSRLMQAGVDTMRADRFTRAVTWLSVADDRVRSFFTEAGWAADGAFRTLDLTGDGEVRVKQIRLHTLIAT